VSGVQSFQTFLNLLYTALLLDHTPVMTVQRVRAMQSASQQSSAASVTTTYEEILTVCTNKLPYLKGKVDLRNSRAALHFVIESVFDCCSFTIPVVDAEASSEQDCSKGAYLVCKQRWI
jgi:hypothetical protein